MYAVRDYPRVAVKSGNTVGKSRVSAQIALWFLLSYYPSKVITTAPSFTQIEQILWKEIATLYHKAKVPIGGDLLKTELKMNDEWFAIGISTNEVNRMQGYHSENLLVIIDEALGVDPMIWEAIEGLHPSKILAIGNPLTPEGDFYQCFQSPLWHKITISCLDAVRWQIDHGKVPGLVSLDWIEERKAEWGEKSALYQSRVLGEFPQEGTDTLIHLAWVDKCRNNQLTEEDDEAEIISSEVATKHGDCETVIIYRKGHTIKKIIRKRRINAVDTANHIKQLNQAHDIDAIVIDSDGFGEGVSDILTNQKIGVYEFHGGHGD